MDSVLEQETNDKLSTIWIQKVEYHKTKILINMMIFVCSICLNQQPFNYQNMT